MTACAARRVEHHGERGRDVAHHGQRGREVGGGCAAKVRSSAGEVWGDLLGEAPHLWQLKCLELGLLALGMHAIEDELLGLGLGGELLEIVTRPAALLRRLLEVVERGRHHRDQHREEGVACSAGAEGGVG